MYTFHNVCIPPAGPYGIHFDSQIFFPTVFRRQWTQLWSVIRQIIKLTIFIFPDCVQVPVLWTGWWSGILLTRDTAPAAWQIWYSARHTSCPYHVGKRNRRRPPPAAKNRPAKSSATRRMFTIDLYVFPDIDLQKNCILFTVYDQAPLILFLLDKIAQFFGYQLYYGVLRKTYQYCACVQIDMHVCMCAIDNNNYCFART